MLEELRQLIALQHLDKEIRALSQAKEEIPAGLNELAARLQETQAAKQMEEQKLEDLQTQHRRLDAEMAEMDDDITRSRERLMEIKDNIEYKAMLKEIAFREDRKDQKETEILELLEEIEVYQQKLAQRQEELGALQSRYEELQAEVRTELAAINRQIQELMEQRPQILQQISPELLKKYEFIRERRNGTAIAEVRQGVCMACHMNLPPQHFIELQKEQEILTCPHCQRIIYWLGPEDQEELASQTAVG
ncbi:MAG: zinc ribbon domain-containing protein [Desulfobacteraceae bacterium]